MRDQSDPNSGRLPDMHEGTKRMRALVRSIIADFRKDEDGAVTVDWVILTAAAVGLMFLVVGSTGMALSDLSGDVSDYIADVPIGFEY